ncbi:hypothetical protein [Thalassospira lucentensis]|uniref:hypothetical protein n=1 Tax=Thalassospira lucentensis TaxID=168935 RepID=UPI0029437838|nr:hypothetical protein [Thalassospira lucentensis]WOI09018.1 hypothetical protein R1T41_00040 [Thalassospira lucentensis]
MMRKLATLSKLLIVTATLSGCVTSGAEDMDVIGTGRGIDEYKISPCACVSLPKAAPSLEDIRIVRDWIG